MPTAKAVPDYIRGWLRSFSCHPKAGQLSPKHYGSDELLPLCHGGSGQSIILGAAEPRGWGEEVTGEETCEAWLPLPTGYWR
ncbi:hypothetical protein GCM10007897_28990 [Sphingobium jiangsuense]|nr:hypothetical protein GCM10007897_28990 [Sphingobium jiangsuense]